MTDGPTIDLAEARRFVAALAGEGARVAWQTFDDDKARKDPRLAWRLPCCPLSTVEGELVTRNGRGAGVYLTVNDTGGSARVQETPVVGLRALFVDCDGTAELPQTWPLAPSIVVQRDATHWHAYWLLVPGEAVERFTAAQTALAGHWRTDWAISDLPRVMRVPGFMHCKAEPVPVALRVVETARRYTIDQVLAAHPVADWSAVPEAHRRKAIAMGLLADDRPARPTVEASAAPVAGPADRQVLWANTVKIFDGFSDAYGKHDTNGFRIAAICQARGFDQAEAAGEVRRYWERCGYFAGGGSEADVARVVRSGYSKQRNDHLPVPKSRPAERTGPRPSFDAAEPPQPPAEEQPAEEPEQPQGPWDNLDLDALKDRWSIGVGGVAPIEWDARKEASVVKITKRLGNLPLWPSRCGRDVATGRSFLELGWVTPAGETRHQWMAEDQVKLGKALLDLPEGPVAGPRWLAAAVWLTEARSAIRNPTAEVTSRLGWCGINGSRRWVWPGTGLAEQARYIGDALPSHGELGKWQAGLEHLLSLDGDKAYTALVCAALSVAAPWARLINGKRNPVIGLLARSSSGKGSVLSWALAPWADAESLTLPASSSVKGLQDRAVQYPDLPIFCDELQQMLDQGQYGQSQASEAVYFLANGQRRVTSSKAQVSVGGEARHGVGFYAAEAPILPGLNSGVHYRVVELRGDPCPDEATARCLRQAGQHTGVLAEAVSRLVQAQDVGAWIEALRRQSAELKGSHVGLEAGDSDVLALLQRGCDVLDQVCGVDMPTGSLVAWVAKVIAEQRRNAIDKETACLQAVLDWLCNLDWTYEDSTGAVQYRTEMVLQQHLVAWSSWINGTGGPLRGSLECDPVHRELVQIFERYGGERRVLPAWAARGWIEKQGAHLKVRKRGCGRVVRFSRAALVTHVGAEDVAMDPTVAEALAKLHAAHPGLAKELAAAAQEPGATPETLAALVINPAQPVEVAP